MGKSTRLNLGCGNDLLPDWTNVDKVHPLNIPEGISFVQDDVLSLSFCRNCTVAKIQANFLLEHVNTDEVGYALYQWNRVLELGGEIHFKVPDFERIANDCVANVFNQMDKTACYNLFKKANYHLLNPGDDAHRSLWTEEFAKIMLPTEGFEITCITHEGFREWYLCVAARKVSGS